MPSTSQGVQLMIGDGATPTENFALLAGVVDFQFPEFEAETPDTSSVDDSYETAIYAGLIRTGMITLTLNWKVSNQVALEALMVAKTTRNFKIVMNDSAGANPTSRVLSCLVKKVGHAKGGVGKHTTHDVTLKLTGAPGAVTQAA